MADQKLVAIHDFLCLVEQFFYYTNKLAIFTKT